MASLLMDTVVSELSAFFFRVMEGGRQSTFLLISIYCFLVLGYSTIYQCRMRRWPSTVGRLATIGKTVFGADSLRADTTYRSKALYEYDVNGQRYLGKRVSSWIVVASHNAKGILDWQARGVEHIADGQVRVFYNPENPSKSLLIRPGLTGIVMVALGAVLPLGLHLYHYYYL